MEDLQKVLGPPPPEGYINVIIAVEDVLLSRNWDVRERVIACGRWGAAAPSLARLTTPPYSDPSPLCSAGTAGCTSRARACASS